MATELQINVYPVTVDKDGHHSSIEHRHVGTITTRATNYIDIMCEDGQIAITLNRDQETNKFQFGVMITKYVKDGDYKERRVYRGNLFDEPFERPSTDAERQALEEEGASMRSRLGRPRAPEINVRPAVDTTPPEFNTGDEDELVDLDEDHPDAEEN